MDEYKKKSLKNLADKNKQYIKKEHQLLRDELNQMSNVINDAIIKLILSFREVITLTETLGKNVDNSNNLGEIKLSVTRRVEQINNELNNMQKALQFEDITQQLINRSINLTNKTDELTGIFENHFSQIYNSSNIKELEELENAFMGYINDAIEFVESEEKPVTQHNLDDGKIEFF